MADWYVKLWDRSYGDGFDRLIGDFSLMEPTAEIRNSEPGGFSGVIAIDQKQRSNPLAGIPRDGNQASSFAPYRTYYQLYRQSTGSGKLISEGILTSTNLNFNRDTILISGKDWLHYLQRRIYPFDPQLYINGGWTQWPRQWPDLDGKFGPRDFIQNPSLAQRIGEKVDVGIIVREIFLSMKYEAPTQITKNATGPFRTTQWPNPPADATTPGVPDFKQNIPLTGQETRYTIYPGDQTTIFDHITKLSEQVEKGFEFDITPGSREFRLWYPRKDKDQYPLYNLYPGQYEFSGAITAFDWTNDGPDGTYLVGLGSRGKKVGNVWTDADNVKEFGRLDMVYDFGEVKDQDMILQLLKDQNDLHPQRKLSLQLLNPEFLGLNFYTGSRPRELIGRRVSVYADFRPYRQVDAQFRVNAIKWTIDASTNESVDLELEMVYEP